MEPTEGITSTVLDHAEEALRRCFGKTKEGPGDDRGSPGGSRVQGPFLGVEQQRTARDLVEFPLVECFSFKQL